MKKVITVLVIVCSTLSLFAQNENKLENSDTKKGLEVLETNYWQLYNSSIYSNYNVGIKTNSPSEELTVQGDLLIKDGRYFNIFSEINSGKLIFQGKSDRYENGISFKGDQGAILGGFHAYGGRNELMYFYIGQDYQNHFMRFIPNGQIMAENEFHAKSNFIVDGAATFNGNVTANTIEATNYIGIKEGLWSERAAGTIYYNGSIGVNTDEPMEALHVNGNARIEGGLNAAQGMYSGGDAFFGGDAEFYRGLTSEGDIHSDGNITTDGDIITNSILSTKNVVITSTGQDGAGIEYNINGTTYDGWKAYGQGNLDYFYVGGNYQQSLMYLKTDGKVQIGSQSQSADVKVKGNLGIYTPGDNKIELADNPEGFMQINKVDNDLGLPTASTYGNIFQKFESSNATLEMGLSQNGTTWLLTRAKDFLNQNAGMHIQPKVDGNTSYRGVGIGFNPSEVIPVDTYLAVNGKVGIGTLTPTTELEVNGTIKATTIEATEILGVNFSQWNFENNNLTFTDGNVGIGITNPDTKLHLDGTVKSTGAIVDGTIYAKEVQVLDPVPQSDYVFESDYKLRTLEEVEQFVKTNKHLPEVPSAADFKENGYSIGEMDDILLRKVEELTLYMIELKKENQALKAQNEAIQEKLESITK